MGLQQTPQLLWGDPAVVGSLALGLIRHAGASVPECGVSAVRVVFTALRQWHPHPGETGDEEMGIPGSLPGLR